MHRFSKKRTQQHQQQSHQQQYKDAAKSHRKQSMSMSGAMRGIIHDLLYSAFRPVAIDVRNISAPHHKEDAFSIEIVSSAFEGMSTSKRYTAVGDVIHANINGPITLLQLSCKTPGEA